MSSIARTCKRQNTIVIATIHQPAWDTLLLFDKLMILSAGRTVYSGRTEGLPAWLTSLGHPTETHRNPSDVAMELVNEDFVTEGSTTEALVAKEGHTAQVDSTTEKHEGAAEDHDPTAMVDSSKRRGIDVVDHFRKTWILMERNGINYSRSLLSYGIRLGMCE